MPPFPNEYEPDTTGRCAVNAKRNTDGEALTEYAAQLLEEINERK